MHLVLVNIMRSESSDLRGALVRDENPLLTVVVEQDVPLPIQRRISVHRFVFIQFPLSVARNMFEVCAVRSFEFQD